MKIVVCPDSFKGCLTAQEAAEAMAISITNNLPQAEVVKLPLADGGEGTSYIMANEVFPIVIESLAQDPLGRMVKAKYYLDKSSKKAFIESAEIIGLPMLQFNERNPLKTSSYGLGSLINDAIQRGCKEIVVSLGGSATCDGGMGMAEALGYKFFDSEDNLLSGNGANLTKVSRIESLEDMPLKNVDIKVLHDVNNPLLGESGAAAIFAPQKGASPEDVKSLEQGLLNLASLCHISGLVNQECEKLPGAGAAGGLGFGTMAFLGGKLIKGIDYILDILDFENKIKDADLIITGEGKADRQSLMGKVVSGVLEKAKNSNVPVIVYAGRVEDEDILLKAGLKAIFSISDPSLPASQNMQKSFAIQNLQKRINQTLFDYLF